jgi:capsule polysaccharide export protein KpsE/RkpR
LEAEKQTLANQLQELAAIGGGKPFQKDRLAEMDRGLDLRIAEQRRLLLGPAQGGKTLNALLLDHEMLVLQVRTSEEALTLARQALASATDAAALGRSTFQIVVPPKTSENAAAPNVVMSGLVALLALLGLFSVVKLLIPSRPY